MQYLSRDKKKWGGKKQKTKTTIRELRVSANLLVTELQLYHTRYS